MAKHEEYFIKVPKDIAQIKQKFMFGLTKRQCICFGIGILVGFPMFYLCYQVLNLGLQISCFALGISASPFVVCGIYQKNGLFFEQAVKMMIDFFKKPKVRTYQSENTYEILERCVEYQQLHRKLQSCQNSKKN